jgi:hypothetical protein
MTAALGPRKAVVLQKPMRAENATLRFPELCAVRVDIVQRRDSMKIEAV